MSLTLTEKLGAAGLLPFVAATASLYLGVDYAEQLFRLYSFAILAFMAGSCWGMAQGITDEYGAKDSITLVASIGVFLLGLCAYFIPLIFATGLFSLGFIILLWLEMRAIIRRVYSNRYKRLRWSLTIVVLICEGVVFSVSSGVLASA
ncbi:DUF3429 domain-containing protein [Thalassolituus sp.]|jgi:hypothetical protein|uniref:DUF3429 domain-containing protein n=1 Tax=Thalassolituus sp. TaxID=2030822 RepID=UPI002A8192C4|nr:DUF3429 domain-containing protein [Thalassolituus sp.]|tara:strand:+ start:2585 stop:3028 length:444 start_codon:yes stop_codon:yes gene_type:complete